MIISSNQVIWVAEGIRLSELTAALARITNKTGPFRMDVDILPLYYKARYFKNHEDALALITRKFKELSDEGFIVQGILDGEIRPDCKRSSWNRSASAEFARINAHFCRVKAQALASILDDSNHGFEILNIDNPNDSQEVHNSVSLRKQIKLLNNESNLQSRKANSRIIVPAELKEQLEEAIFNMRSSDGKTTCENVKEKILQPKFQADSLIALRKLTGMSDVCLSPDTDFATLLGNEHFILRDFKNTSKKNGVSDIKCEISGYSNSKMNELQGIIKREDVKWKSAKYPVFDTYSHKLRSYVAITLGTDVWPDGIKGLGPKKIHDFLSTINKNGNLSEKEVEDAFVGFMLSSNKNHPLFDKSVILALSDAILHEAVVVEETLVGEPDFRYIHSVPKKLAKYLYYFSKTGNQDIQDDLEEGSGSVSGSSESDSSKSDISSYVYDESAYDSLMDSTVKTDDYASSDSSLSSGFEMISHSEACSVAGETGTEAGGASRDDANKTKEPVSVTRGETGAEAGGASRDDDANKTNESVSVIRRETGAEAGGASHNDMNVVTSGYGLASDKVELYDGPPFDFCPGIQSVTQPHIYLLAEGRHNCAKCQATFCKSCGFVPENLTPAMKKKPFHQGKDQPLCHMCYKTSCIKEVGVIDDVQNIETMKKELERNNVKLYEGALNHEIEDLHQHYVIVNERPRYERLIDGVLYPLNNGSFFENCFNRVFYSGPIFSEDGFLCDENISQERVLGIIQLMASFVKYKQSGISPYAEAVPSNIIDFANGSRATPGTAHKMIKSCLRHVTDPRFPSLTHEDFSLFTYDGEYGEETIGIVLSGKVPPSMKSVHYDTKVAVTKDHLVACSCDCIVSGLGTAEATAENIDDDRITCIHNLPLSLAVTFMMHDVYSNHFLYDLTSRWDGDLEDLLLTKGIKTQARVRKAIITIMRSSGVAEEVINAAISHTSVIKMLEAYQTTTQKVKTNTTAPPRIHELIPFRDLPCESVETRAKRLREGRDNGDDVQTDHTDGDSKTQSNKRVANMKNKRQRKQQKVSSFLIGGASPLELFTGTSSTTSFNHYDNERQKTNNFSLSHQNDRIITQMEAYKLDEVTLEYIHTADDFDMPDKLHLQSYERLIGRGMTRHGSLWLDNDVINMYMHMLNELDALVNPQKRSHILNTEFMFWLTDTSHGFDYAAVERWCYFFPERDIFSKMKYLIAPLNISNTHWSKLWVDFELKAILYGDSLALSGIRYMKAMLKFLKTYAENNGLEFDEKEWELIDMFDNIPQQTNGDDCGVFVLLNTYCKIVGVPPTYTQQCVTRFRSRDIIALSLLDEELYPPITIFGDASTSRNRTIDEYFKPNGNNNDRRDDNNEGGDSPDGHGTSGSKPASKNKSNLAGSQSENNNGSTKSSQHNNKSNTQASQSGVAIYRNNTISKRPKYKEYDTDCDFQSDTEEDDSGSIYGKVMQAKRRIIIPRSCNIPPHNTMLPDAFTNRNTYSEPDDEDSDSDSDSQKKRKGKAPIAKKRVRRSHPESKCTNDSDSDSDDSDDDGVLPDLVDRNASDSENDTQNKRKGKAPIAKKRVRRSHPESKCTNDSDSDSDDSDDDGVLPDLVDRNASDSENDTQNKRKGKAPIAKKRVRRSHTESKCTNDSDSDSDDSDDDGVLPDLVDRNASDSENDTQNKRKGKAPIAKKRVSRSHPESKCTNDSDSDSDDSDDDGVLPDLVDRNASDSENDTQNKRKGKAPIAKKRVRRSHTESNGEIPHLVNRNASDSKDDCETKEESNQRPIDLEHATPLPDYGSFKVDYIRTRSLIEAIFGSARKVPMKTVGYKVLEQRALLQKQLLLETKGANGKKAYKAKEKNAHVNWKLVILDKIRDQETRALKCNTNANKDTSGRTTITTDRGYHGKTSRRCSVFGCKTTEDSKVAFESIPKYPRPVEENELKKKRPRDIRRYFRRKILRDISLSRLGLPKNSNTEYRVCANHEKEVITVHHTLERGLRKRPLKSEFTFCVPVSQVKQQQQSKGVGADRYLINEIKNIPDNDEKNLALFALVEIHKKEAEEDPAIKKIVNSKVSSLLSIEDETLNTKLRISGTENVRKNRKSSAEPMISMEMSNHEVKDRTGFDSMKHLLAYVAIVCNGATEEMIRKTNLSTLTWWEEWFLAFEVIWGRSRVNQKSLARKYRLNATRKNAIVDEKLKKILKSRNSWPEYCSFTEDMLLRAAKWKNILDDNDRMVQHDTTNIMLRFKPSLAETQKLTYNQYYNGNCGKGDVAVQPCGWIRVDHLWVGGISDNQYMLNNRIFERQQRYQMNDLVNDRVVPFLNVLDRGYKLTLQAKKCNQNVRQPAFQHRGRRFTGTETLRSASCASVRSGNERAVNKAKIAGFLRKGLRPKECPRRLDDVWLAWGFMINFMYMENA